MSEDGVIISLCLKGIPSKPFRYKLTREDDLFWHGIPINDPSTAEKSIPKFVWDKIEEL